MHLFGLTGGIATGKSTVASRLRARGVPVLDADQLAREVVAPGTEGLREVVRAFGESALDASGALDRKAVARRVFSDAGARHTLDRITHPRIVALMLERAGGLERAGEPLACYEAALIVENGAADAFRPLVVCACSEDAQLARLQSREGLSRADALARVHAQRPLADKVAAADYVVDTGGAREESARRTDEVLRGICERLGVDPGRYGVGASP